MAAIARRLWTADEYERLAGAGILTEDERIELIEGEIITMSPTGSSHAGCLNRLVALLSTSTGGSAIVAAQNPVRLNDDSEPQPDVALLRPRPDFYATSHPRSEDILLLVEVADTSMTYDQGVKRPLYAAAGVPEVWIVALPETRVYVCRRPTAGRYADVQVYGRGATISVEQLPGVGVAVDQIIGN